MKNKHFIFWILLSLFIVGCGEQTRDPALDQMWDSTVEIFDSLSAVEQAGFLTTFRPTAESSAENNLSGNELSERLAFIAELDAELRRRKK